MLFYVLGEDQPSADLTVSDPDGRVVARLSGPGRKGLNRIVWDLKSDGAIVPAGMYYVRLAAGGRSLRRTLFVEPDPDPGTGP